MKILKTSAERKIEGYVFERTSMGIELRHYYYNRYSTYTYDTILSLNEDIFLKKGKKQTLLEIAKQICPRKTKIVYYSMSLA